MGDDGEVVVEFLLELLHITDVVHAFVETAGELGRDGLEWREQVTLGLRERIIETWRTGRYPNATAVAEAVGCCRNVAAGYLKALPDYKPSWRKQIGRAHV